MGKAQFILLIVFTFIAGIYFGNNERRQTNRNYFLPSLPSSFLSLSPLVESAEGAGIESFELAKTQSFGFFDDISEDNWRLMQARARTRINHAFPSHPLLYYRSTPNWFLNNFEPDFTCGQERRLGGSSSNTSGGVGVGPKWVCDPHRLARVSKERQQEGGPGCLVYSIGCGGEWHLEEGLLELLGPICEIHVFDPIDYSSSSSSKNNNEQSPVPPSLEGNIHFHQWGLIGSNSIYRNSRTTAAALTHSSNNGVLLQYRTLQDTLQTLGHENRPIDIMKVDCEFCEWSLIKDCFSTKQQQQQQQPVDVRQLLLRTYRLPPDKQQGLDFFLDLQRHHFYLFHKEAHLFPRNEGEGVELSYIRLHPDFISNNTSSTNSAELK